ncbi:MAG: hypothetical protein AMXMBFR17_27240 [Candidatus Jettenia caeni]|nr:MAG: hypothetical protein JETCAE04_08460 [Candidatus Jettenia caeni]
MSPLFLKVIQNLFQLGNKGEKMATSRQKIKLMVIGLILISCMSCITMGSTFRDDDFNKIKPR